MVIFYVCENQKVSIMQCHTYVDHLSKITLQWHTAADKSNPLNNLILSTSSNFEYTLSTHLTLIQYVSVKVCESSYDGHAWLLLFFFFLAVNHCGISSICLTFPMFHVSYPFFFQTATICTVFVVFVVIKATQARQPDTNRTEAQSKHCVLVSNTACNCWLGEAHAFKCTTLWNMADCVENAVKNWVLVKDQARHVVLYRYSTISLVSCLNIAWPYFLSSNRSS